MSITEQEIKDKANALRNLVSFKGKTEEEILEKARELLEKDQYDVDIGSMFSNKAEVKQARVLLGKYLDDYSIETISDKNTLKEVIYLEIVQQRLQEKLNEFYAGEAKAVPLQLVELIHKNSDAILKLKFSLGLSKEKETKKSGLDVLGELKKRFAVWRSENQGTRTLTCPHCGKMIMLKIRTDAWKAQKHPFFKDRILTNKHLLELYKKGTITKRDVAKVLECASDYVDWIIEKSVAPVESKKLAPSEAKGEASARKEQSEDKDMHRSAEKIKIENRCPECENGFLSCRMAEDGTGRWEEHCTSCEFHQIHDICRRKTQIPIDFPDRRKAPSSLESEETENDSEGNKEGSPGHREGTGAEETRATDSEDKGSS